MSPWEEFLELPPSGGHFVQLYETDDAAVIRNFGFYVWTRSRISIDIEATNRSPAGE